ncbi:MAG: hypothetical protein WC071_02460 [Victivallaceae bacterium]
MNYFYFMRRYHLFVLALSVGLAIAGCNSAKPEPKAWNPVKKSYPVLKDYQLKLYPVGNKEFAAGQNADLSLCLRNFGKKQIRIDEWHMNEQDNIRIYYHPWQDDLFTFEPSKWTVVNPDFKQPINHFQLVLLPNNSVIITKPLPFVKTLKPSGDGSERRLLMVAELTLKSVTVRSSIFSITVKEQSAQMPK